MFKEHFEERKGKKNQQIVPTSGYMLQKNVLESIDFFKKTLTCFF